MLLMGMIFLLSSIPGGPNHETLDFMVMLNPKLQNVLHIPLYALLQYLFLRSFAKVGKTGYVTIFIVLAITFSYGLFDEFHQSFVIGRYASFTDVCLNLLGALLGTGFFLFARNYSIPQERTG